ncbi:MAG: ORF6N domain-containing protein [Pyrinomonadaceae bacterium]|nr:ORF6N domain-containing protein [Pyrinomonadaceae bacterium]
MRLAASLAESLNEQVRRNRDDSPEDSMFQLTAEESGTLRSQIATSNSHGGRRYLISRHISLDKGNGRDSASECLY